MFSDRVMSPSPSIPPSPKKKKETQSITRLQVQTKDQYVQMTYSIQSTFSQKLQRP